MALTRRHFLLSAAAAAALSPARALANSNPPYEWLQSHRPTTLWADAEGPRELAAAGQGSYFRTVGQVHKARVLVEDYARGIRGWVEAAHLGPAAAPPGAAAPATPTPAPQAPPLAAVPPPAVDDPSQWWGTVVEDEAVAYAEPRRGADVVATFPGGTKLGIQRWVEGDELVWDDPAWGELAQGGFVYGRVARPLPIEQPPTPPLPEPPASAWIGINRIRQLIVAYEREAPLFWALTSTGRPGWETAPGSFRIQRRVAKDTMDSRTLLGRDAHRASYRIQNVRHTQYFTGDGNAIHENYWKDQDLFGLPSSHGCAGLRPDDASRFWEFGELGMPVVVHD